MSYNLLKGKRGIIFGALNDKSIAWKVAERAVAEGAKITLSNTEVAIRMGDLDELAAKTGAEMIAADATSVEDLTNVFKKSMEVLGGKIDFVLHSIGMSPNVRKSVCMMILTTICSARLSIFRRYRFTRCCRSLKSSTPSMTTAVLWLCRTWLHSAHCSVITIWRCQGFA